MADRQQFWNDRYSTGEYIFGTEPNAFLAAQEGRLRRGMRALLPADGEGRNGVWLAERGVEVLSVDYSRAALEKARRLAASRGVSIRTEQADLESWDWPKDEFDLAVASFVHVPPELRRHIHRSVVDALVPGGLVILEAYRPEQLRYRDEHGSGGPGDVDLLYTPEMLREDFSPLEVLHLTEEIVELDEGPRHRGPAAVVRAVFRRPDGS